MSFRIGFGLLTRHQYTSVYLTARAREQQAGPASRDIARAAPSLTRSTPALPARRSAGARAPSSRLCRARPCALALAALSPRRAARGRRRRRRLLARARRRRQRLWRLRRRRLLRRRRRLRRRRSHCARARARQRRWWWWRRRRRRRASARLGWRRRRRLRRRRRRGLHAGAGAPLSSRGLRERGKRRVHAKRRSLLPRQQR
jgi:hypothetical protein